MELLSNTAFSIANSFIFWAAWIIIPIVMEIVPSVHSLFLLIKRKAKKEELPKPAIFPEITIIIPIYNSQDTLEDCLRSVNESSYPNNRIRVFCVDNQSKDDSFKVFSNCQTLFPELIMQWMKAEQGKSRALNTALYNSTSKYVVHIDSDGVLEKKALENMVTLFESDDSISCATGAILVRPDLIEKYPRGLSRLFRKLEFVEYGQAFLAGRNSASESNKVYTLSGAFSAFRSSAIRKSWLYNTETIAEDTQITFQMRYLQNERIYECEDALFFVDPIENVDKLYTQRQRWQRGSLEVAKLFGGDRLKARKIFSDVSVNTLMYDHTFAFPRVIWYLALFCLLFLGYSGMMVLGAMGVIFLLYIVCGYFYFFTSLSFLKEFPETRSYYRRQWWVVMLLPFFNLAVFFIRLAGIVNSIGTSSSWKTKTLTEEREDFAGIIHEDTAKLRLAGKKLRSVFNVRKNALSKNALSKNASPKSTLCKNTVGKKKRLLHALGLVGALVVYALVAGVVIYTVKTTGNYPNGSDTMFYVYRGDFLYRSITEQGNWYPLLDPQWYNGVQTLRYWSPMPEYILVATQAFMGGDSFAGYLLFLGTFYFANAVAWLYLGFKFKRPVLGFFIGLVWYFVPNNLFMLFGEGVVARALSMCVMPLLVAFIYDYLDTKRWSNLPRIMLCFMFVAMCHVGWAGMFALTLLIFLAIYAVLNRHVEHGKISHIFAACILGFLICGLWIAPSLIGGITTLNSADIMANFFQPLVKSLNPFYGIEEGSWNRWVNPSSSQAPYFGLGMFVICLFGCFVSTRKVAPGFATAAIVCLLTSVAAYPVLVMLPGSQYLWMLRFISVALTFAFVSIFFWRTLRISLQSVVCLIVSFEVVAASAMITKENEEPIPENRYEAIRQEVLIDKGEAITAQRFSAVEPYSSIADAIYVMAGFGDEAKPTTYGQGVQSAVTYKNLVQVNEAAEKGLYYYMFDRLRELGNDTVLMPVENVKNSPSYDPEKLADAARASNYDLVASNGRVNLYHLRGVEGTFGVKSSFEVLGIGSSASTLAMNFPSVKESPEKNLNAYSYEQLSKYKLVVLCDFVYEDKTAAEDMIRRLSENGTHVVILADGIPLEEETQSRTFLGIDCETINFTHGYPELKTIIGNLNTTLFPAEYSEWKTVYVNGLKNVWGTIENDEHTINLTGAIDKEKRTLDFMGTGENDNLVFVGLGLTFYESLTQDKNVEKLLNYAFDLDPSELPKRKIVPLDIKYEPRQLTIVSSADNVDTTLAFHDIFSSEQTIWDENKLLYVNKGTTVIALNYPYFWQGLAISGAGILLTVLFLRLTYVRRRRQDSELQNCELKKSDDTIAPPVSDSTACGKA